MQNLADGVLSYPQVMLGGFCSVRDTAKGDVKSRCTRRQKSRRIMLDVSDDGLTDVRTGQGAENGI